MRLPEDNDVCPLWAIGHFVRSIGRLDHLVPHGDRPVAPLRTPPILLLVFGLRKKQFQVHSDLPKDETALALLESATAPHLDLSFSTPKPRPTLFAKHIFHRLETIFSISDALNEHGIMKNM